MSDLLIHRHGRVLQLTLNRPQARNALNNALLTQIAEALEAAAVDDSVGVCVIRGNARFFAAGADLNEMAEKDLPATLDDIRPRLWARIDAFTKPLIASVNGYALGAGCELALLCDLIVAVWPAGNYPRHNAGRGRHPAADPQRWQGAGQPDGAERREY